ncbi:hypothetical protein GCM10007890_03470 [Methylobacterium tardum]|uniref:Uncharacterized protein n=1 Tax=Methylobacterium tardum TaxID=374432 RepID=A0AA37WNV5_9HYPH|nr:hypothetical protein GCM10007890_03470 [Methylobacterium tardum]
MHRDQEAPAQVGGERVDEAHGFLPVDPDGRPGEEALAREHGARQRERRKAAIPEVKAAAARPRRQTHDQGAIHAPDHPGSARRHAARR